MSIGEKDERRMNPRKSKVKGHESIEISHLEGWYTGRMGRIGIFGGTFDPPHIGHLMLAAEAMDQFRLDKVVWVLTPDSPLKKGQAITALPQRLDMVQLALAEAPEFELSRVDIDRPSPHYAVDTVRILAKQTPQAELMYLMGGDSLRDLPRWHDPQGFVQACGAIGVMRRPEDRIDLKKLEQELPGVSAKVRFLACPLLEVAAHEIRARVAQGRPYRYFLTAGVYDYIVREGLYR